MRGGGSITTAQLIKMALSYQNMSQAQLARHLGTTPPNLNQKMKRGTLTPEDLKEISVILGVGFICSFQFPDGTTVSLSEGAKGSST